MIVAVLVLLAILLGLLAGIPIGAALGLGGILGLYLVFGWDLTFAHLGSLPYALTADYNFAVFPLFILMGYLLSAAGVASEIYQMAYRWLGRMRSGLIIATTVAAAFFGTLSGSSVASAAIFTKVALPEMLQAGYDRRIAAGSIAAAGTLAATIPPSILLVLYGIITGESVGWLLIAGVVPGFLTAAVYSATAYVVSGLRPQWCPTVTVTFTWRERLVSLRGLWTVAVLFIAVIGGLYAGLFTPTSAGAVGAFGALAIAVMVRRCSLSTMLTAMRQSVEVTSTIFIIVIGGYLFGRFMALSGVITAISEFATGLSASPVLILAAIGILYLVLGMFMDGASIMVLTLPVLHPVIKTLGFDPIWFGILVAILIEMGLMTPPVGLNTYVVYGAAEGRVKLHEVFIGTAPFLAANVVVIALLFAVPDIALWLPSTMAK